MLAARAVKPVAVAGAAAPRAAFVTGDRDDEDSRAWAAALRAVGAGGVGDAVVEWSPELPAYEGSPRLAEFDVPRLAVDVASVPVNVTVDATEAAGTRGVPPTAPAVPPASPAPPPAVLAPSATGARAADPTPRRSLPAARHARVPTTFEGVLRALTPFEDAYYAPPRAGVAPGRRGMTVDVLARGAATGGVS